MKSILLSLLSFFLIFSLYAKDADSLVVEVQKYIALRDSVNNALHYQTGLVKLTGSLVEFNIPKGFKYLDTIQSKYVIEKLWGNLPQENLMGMLFPENSDPFDDSSYAFIITYSDIGYVKDDDAGKIDYDELLSSMQKDEEKENKERIALGLRPLYTVGWAEKPYYDNTNKVLHWAFRIKTDDSSENTLNYKIILLGRKGILTVNAVAHVSSLDSVKSHIAGVTAIPKFTEGNTYKDFNPGIDHVAAWTIGALVAGKLLAKVGLFAIIGKYLLAFWKFILLGIAAIGAAARKFFRGRKADEPEAEPVPAELPAEENTENLS